MSVFHPYTVRDPNGQNREVFLVRTLNIDRMPDARQQIIDGTFQVFKSDEVHKTFRVHRPFAYIDSSRGTFYHVLPQAERYRWESASDRLRRSFDSIPSNVLSRESNVRVVFGLSELREKLVAQDANLDDRFVELLKVFVVYEHPFLLRHARLNIYLEKANDDEISFIATFDHDRQVFRVSFPLDVVEELVDREDELQKWVGANHAQNIYTLENTGDYWVNFWRWSPQTRALNTLWQFSNTINSGGAIDLDGRSFDIMVTYLPHGSHLPSWAKRALRVVHTYVKDQGRGDLEKRLFEIRFDMELEDDWAKNNDPDDIDTLWNLLKDLPDSNVEGNTYISELLLLEGEEGGWYDTQSFEIGIGEDELDDQEDFEDVVRHEVGHAVHRQRESLVDGWLRNEFGWQSFRRTNQGIDTWVNLMGGWGNLTYQERQEVRGLIRQALGTHDWYPGPYPNPPTGHPWWQANFGPRLALENSLAGNQMWWRNNQVWYRTNGMAFAYNFYYKELMVVREPTIQLLGQMPDSYAAMSPAEFFAELYAVYYDVEDNQDYLPDHVTQWLATNLGLPETDGA